jgi:hypothetical protein
MLRPRHQGRLRICLFHRQLQAAPRRGRWTHEPGRKVTLGTLLIRVRACVIISALHGAALRTRTPSRHRGVLAEHGVRLNTLGRTQLFPPAVQEALAKAKELTKNNNR